MSDQVTGLDCLAGGGEMGALMRAKDWSQTPLGPVSNWPQSLKIVLRILLTSRYAMWLGWGDDFHFFYNDAYRPTLGVKHPWALGVPAREVWAEIWTDIGPRADTVLRHGLATWDEALLLFLERSGFREETYHTFSYSPIPDDVGGIGGLLCVVTEETDRVLSERRLRALRQLGTDLSGILTELQVLATIERHLQMASKDLPFALAYVLDSHAKVARLVCASGAQRGADIAPPTITIDDAGAPWPVAELLAQRTTTIVTDLAEAFTEIPTGHWDVPPREAVLVPIAQQGQEGIAGFFIVGLNPYRPYDTGYRGFIDLLAGQIAAGLGKARAFEEERRRAEALAELDRAKTAFFSNVSHEFRTPLTLMLGPLDDMLGDGGSALAADDRERIAVVRRNGQRLLKLVNNLLDFARIEAGRVQAVFEPVELAGYTAELASVFRSAIEKAGMRLVVDCPALPAPVYIDRDMWEKMVLNLLSNAFKYTLAGEIRVSLQRRGNMALLQVQDTGTGIPAAELPKLFNRFHRVEGAGGRTHEGTGIGLALVQELAHLHGGTVDVESTVGVGSMFSIMLPLGSAHLPAERIAKVRPKPATPVYGDSLADEALRWLETDTAVATTNDATPPDPQSQDKDRPLVVLADDNADMRDYVRRLLLPHYRVSAVADGEQALQAIRKERPAIVLTDVMMPNLDGFGLLKAVRKDPQLADIPIIMLSARAGEEARVDGLDAGADDYLIKPFSAREMLARVQGTIALAQERSQLRRNRERLDWVVDKSGIGLWYWDLPQPEQQWNRQCKEHFGLPPDAEVTFDLFVSRLYPEDRERTLAGIEDSIRNRLPYDIDYRTVGLDGRLRWVRAIGRVFVDPNDQPTRFDGITIDITDRKQAEIALREADRRKDEFLATLAHELRNPLAPIRNALQIIKLSGGGPVPERIHQMMDRQVNHMVRLVDDLLEVSRITRGKIELRRERVDLADILSSAIETSKPLIELSQHRLHLELPNRPLPLMADAMRLGQVFANLLNNAAKYTERGGDIWVIVYRDGHNAVVKVHDSGLGIPPEMLPKVFELFTQIDRTLGRAQGGLGIGLTLVKRLVEMHDGEVIAASAGLGHGTTLTVTLPLLATHVETARLVVNGAAQPAQPTSARVLIVDDNHDAAESLAMLLRLLGMEVHVAYDGQGAIEAVASVKPAIVLLDLGMPGMDGYEVARRLRQDNRHWPVLVALTGWGQEDDRRRTRLTGFDHHLVKPVEYGALLGLLDEITTH